LRSGDYLVITKAKILAETSEYSLLISDGCSGFYLTSGISATAATDAA
jgi:hypothetical protein